MAAHVPVLLHPHPKDVLVIGLGPGQTASRFLTHPINRLDCVKIERELIQLVRDHFDSGRMDDLRVHFLIEDGRNILAHARREYDIVSIEVGQIFLPGVASSYTRECYEATRRHLRAHGLVCQFVPVSFFATSEFRAIVGTFLDVFPHSVLWYNLSELMILGSVDVQPMLSQGRLAELESNRAVHRDLAFAYWGGRNHLLHRPEVFCAGFLAGLRELAALAADAPLYYDDVPSLEYTTANRKRLRSRLEISTVQLVQSHLSPCAEIFATNTPSWSDVVPEIRQRNLGDILASVIHMPVEQLRAAGNE